MKVLDLFSGIGGFSLGLERAGMETVAFCEIEDYPRKVLAKHWPDVPCYGDVRTLTKERLDNDGVGSIDVICGGFPCQDISVAGRQAGLGEETRSGLWSECARLLGEIRPSYAIFENVTALLSGDNGQWFQRVLWDISQVGYDAEWHCIPASHLGAQHIRDRVWIVAHSNGNRPQGGDNEPSEANGAGGAPQGGSPGRASSEGAASDTECWQQKLEVYSSRIRRENKVSRDGYWETLSEPFVCRRTHGIPGRAHRLKGLGNAVCPQIPEIIGRAIMQLEP